MAIKIDGEYLSPPFVFLYIWLFIVLLLVLLKLFIIILPLIVILGILSYYFRRNYFRFFYETIDREIILGIKEKMKSRRKY